MLISDDIVHVLRYNGTGAVLSITGVAILIHASALIFPL